MAGVRCRIKIVLSPLQSVLAEATARTARLAFGDAIQASSRAVRHLRERRRRIRASDEITHDPSGGDRTTLREIPRFLARM
jgi:hypothetical protein